MATVTRTIISGGGGNYLSITLHEAATNLNGGADIWKGVISDTAAYDESVTFDQDGTSDSSYYWLTVDAADRHAGIWTTSKARLVNSGGDTAAFTITGDRVRIGELLMNRSNPGNSDECIRVSGADNVLLENMVFHGDGSVRDTDGVYTTSTSTPTRFVNCIAYGFGRAGFHDQSSGTRTNRFDHCLSVLNGQNTSSDHYGNIGASNSATCTWEMYNTVAIELGSAVESYEIRDSGSTTTLNGAYNAVTADSTTYVSAIDTDNATNWVEATDGLVDTAPTTAGVYITETDLATFDATPVDHANNVLLDGGVAQTGGDARANLALDIAGNVRPTSGAVDVGPFHISGAGGAPVELTASSSDSLTATATGSHVAEMAASSSDAATATGTGSHVATLTASSSDALTGTADPAVVAELAAASSDALTGTADPSHVAELDAFGSDALTATATGTVAGAPVELSASSSDSLTATSTGSHVAVLAASSSDALTAAGTGAHVATLAASSSDPLTATGTGSHVAALEASSSDALTGSADPSVRVELAASSSDALTATATGTVAGVVELTASSSDALTATAVPSYVAELSASSSDSLTASTTGSATAELSATSADVFMAIATGSFTAALGSSGVDALTGAALPSHVAELMASGVDALTAIAFALGVRPVVLPIRDRSVSLTASDRSISLSADSASVRI